MVVFFCLAGQYVALVPYVDGASGPYKTLPAACSLLPTGELGPVFLDPAKKPTGRKRCVIEERAAALAHASA